MALADADKPKRNDLPDRAAKRIVETIFGRFSYKADDVRYVEQAALMSRLLNYSLTTDISRCIWEEMLLLEGEIILGQKGLPK